MRRASVLAGLVLLAAVPARADGELLRVDKPSVRSVEGIGVDVRTAALRSSSNVRLAVVPAGSPDAVDDVNAFAARSVPVHVGGRVRMTLPPGPPGADEVRLYHVPAGSAGYVVADRARVSVAAGTPGAVPVAALAAEARALGPVRFEAQYRGKQVVVEAQFLRVWPESTWDVRWFGGVPVSLGTRPAVVLELGVRGAPAAGGAVCMVGAETREALGAVAQLTPGDAVVVEGEPSIWSAAGPGDPVVVRGCSLR